MLPFDSNDYRRRVLAAVHARGGAEQSDPFEIYDIPIDEAAQLGHGAVRARLDEVWAFWQRSRDHPRYRGVIIALLGLHDQLSATLLTAAARAELVERVTAARAVRDGERFAEFDAAVRRLVTRFGGLPEDKIVGLRALAATHGIDEAAFALRIRRYRVLAPGVPERTDPTPVHQPVSAEVMRQLRADLDELGRIAGTTPPRSLFDLLGVAPGSSRAEIAAVRDAAMTRNRERRPDRRRALLDDLLTAARALLVEGDPEAYLDAMVEPVTVLLRPRVATAVLIEDRLLPAAAAEFVATAQAEGLDLARARAVVAELARENGVDAPVTAGAQRPVTGDGATATGRGSPAGRGSPGGRGSATGHGSATGQGSSTALPVPPRASDWQVFLSRARAALRAGRPIEASDEITRARELAGETLPPIRALGDEVERVIRTAGERWRVIVAELAADNHRAVVRLTAELAAVAADVPGPAGRALDEVRAQAQARCAAADELVARARTAPVTERVRLSRAALALVADHDEARALLAGDTSAGPQGIPEEAGPAEAAGPAPGAGSEPRPAQSPEAERTRPAEERTRPAEERTRPAREAAGTASADLPEPRRSTSGPAAATAGTPSVVEPPSDVAARWDGSSVVISWRPSATPGDVRYRIRRITPDGNARAVGVTSATVIEDGGVFRGSSIPEYEVIAGVGGAWSEPARWPVPTVVPAPPDSDPDPDPDPNQEPARAEVPDLGGPEPDEPEPASGGDVPEVPAPAVAAAVEIPPPGPGTSADGLGPVADPWLVDGRLRWTWPEGCTEMMVAVRADLPPAGAQELGASTRKITNTRYDIDGGFLLPDLRPLHVALFACVRERGALVVAGAAAARCLIDADSVLTVVRPKADATAGTVGAGGAGQARS